LRCQARQIVIRDTLLQADIALEETADGLWALSCYDVWVARLDEPTVKVSA
jgi:hypothetical protein